MKKYVVFVLLVVSACTRDQVDSTPINAEGEILFISRRTPDGEWTMYIMNADGTNQRAILNSYVRCAPPVPSHNGKRIAFTTYENYYYKLYAIDKDGQNLVFLSQSQQYCGAPIWSPDDSKIAFLKNDLVSGDSHNIFLINSNGTNEIKLTNDSYSYLTDWSPDGKMIFTSGDLNTNGVFSVYSMNSDGTNRQRLTPLAKSFSGGVLAPGGGRIAMVSLDRNGSQIFVMNVDGSGLKQLTFTVSPKYFDIGYPRDANSSPAWSPDGSKIAYVSWENGTPDIFIMNSNGGYPRRLTNGPIRDEDPSWTKDGKYILFSSNRQLNMSSEIYIMKANGGSQTPLTKYMGDDSYPIFIEK